MQLHRHLRTLLFFALSVLGCGPARTPDAAVREAPLVVLVSANAEWKAVKVRFPDVELRSSPYGEWFVRQIPDGPSGAPVLFFHGGWGKISAASSTQYVIDRFHPSLLVNLGTCGGFGDGMRVGDVVLVEEAIVYDIVEQMGDPDEAIADYTTKLDVGRWPASLRPRVRVARIVSGDRDLLPADLPRLREHFHAAAGDWESGSIAWVSAKNRTPVLILRGVSDIVGEHGDALYGNLAGFEAASNKIMSQLIALLAEAVPKLR